MAFDYVDYGVLRKRSSSKNGALFSRPTYDGGPLLVGKNVGTFALRLCSHGS